ncbi:hypothetical protein NUSPORA_00059 [Nucleospora cyclopteri]
MVFSKITVGSKYSESYKIYITQNGNIISPFHDIPLYDGEFVNCICEIPRFENAKFEISKDQEFNPIVQDKKKGKLRFVANIYPFKGYQVNYGALPQTYEDPAKMEAHIEAYGDNDPLDILEIGMKTKSPGDVFKGKVLGCLAMIDDNEADWKILIIDANDPLAHKINDVPDVKEFFPGLLENLYIWFRDYKKSEGKPENEFGFEGQFLNAEFAKKIVEEGFKSHQKLLTSKNNKISLKSAKKGDTMTVKEEKKEDSDVPEIVHQYFFANTPK